MQSPLVLVHYLTSSGSMLRKDLGEGSDEGSSTNSHEVPRRCCCMHALLPPCRRPMRFAFPWQRVRPVSARLTSVVSCHSPGRGADGGRRCAFNIT